MKEPRTAAWAVLLLLAACGTPPPPTPPPAEEGPPVRGDWLVAPLEADPSTLNWLLATDSPARQIGRLVADSLVDHGPDLEYVPRLAESWAVSADGRTVTFHLRPGVRWHDGEAFTAADVLFTFQRARDPETGGPLAGYFSEVESVEAPDPATVVATYRTPFSPALQGWTVLLILPRHLFEAADLRDARWSREPVGTGPYRFVSWSVGREIVLEANDGYWGGRPHLDRIVFRVLADLETAYGSLLTGELDMATVPQSRDPAELAERTGGRLRHEQDRRRAVSFIAWNGDGSNPFFSDAAVRRAMTLSLDRAAFIERVLHGRGVPASSTFVPGTWAYDDSLSPLPHDPVQASALLDEVGWIDRDADGLRDRDGRAFRFTVVVLRANPWANALAQVLQDSLRGLGVEVGIEPLEWSAFLQTLHGRQFQAQISNWNLDPDPDPFDFWHSSQSPSGSNYAGYADEDLDRWCEEGRRTFDTGERRRLYLQVQQRLHRDQPFTFLHHPVSIVGFDARLHGVRWPAAGLWAWFPASLEWWVPRELQRYPRGGENGSR